MTEPTQNPEQHHDENQIMAERRHKLAALREQGPAFPNDFRRSHQAGALHAAYDDTDKDALTAEPIEVAVAGRMMLKRVMGKASFATLQDVSGRIQLYITNDITGADTHAAFKHWDMGDILGAVGTLLLTVLLRCRTDSGAHGGATQHGMAVLPVLPASGLAEFCRAAGDRVYRSVFPVFQRLATPDCLI